MCKTYQALLFQYFFRSLETGFLRSALASASVYFTTVVLLRQISGSLFALTSCSLRSATSSFDFTRICRLPPKLWRLTWSLPITRNEVFVSPGTRRLTSRMHLIRLHLARLTAHTIHDALRYEGSSYTILFLIANPQDAVLSLNVRPLESFLTRFACRFRHRQEDNLSLWRPDVKLEFH
jgi:hypothetical protein